MINTDYRKLEGYADKLFRKKIEILWCISELNKAAARLSQYTDFNDQIIRIHRLSTRLENDSYNLFCIGRALELVSEQFYYTERRICSLLDGRTVRAQAKQVFRSVGVNPVYIRII